MTNFPGGVASFGVPVLPSAGQSTGQVFFVHSSGSNGNTGKTPAKPFATLAKAISQCTAAKGDTIYVMPGHTETLIAAAGVAVSVAGVRIVGLGNGKNRPVFNYTTSAAASFDVTAANVYVENLYFRPIGVASVTSAVNVSAADACFVNCEWELGDATNAAVQGLTTTAAADRLRVLNCKFHGVTTASTNALKIVGGDAIEISGCTFQGPYASGSGAIQNVTTACTNCIVKDNVINNLTASSTKVMVFVSTSTGQISRNYMQILSGTAPITGAAMSWVGANYYGATIAAAGTLI
jgi:hypothetical protein